VKCNPMGLPPSADGPSPVFNINPGWFGHPLRAPQFGHPVRPLPRTFFLRGSQLFFSSSLPRRGPISSDGSSNGLIARFTFLFPLTLPPSLERWRWAEHRRSVKVPLSTQTPFSPNPFSDLVTAQHNPPCRPFSPRFFRYFPGERPFFFSKEELGLVSTTREGGPSCESSLSGAPEAPKKALHPSAGKALVSFKTSVSSPQLPTGFSLNCRAFFPSFIMFD